MAIQSILVLLSSVLCYLAFPPFNLFWIQCLSLIPLLFFLYNCYSHFFSLSYSKQLLIFSLIGFLFGLFYMGLTNLWIFELVEFSTLLTMTIVFIFYTLIEAFFFALITCCYRLCHCKPVLFPFIWIIVEWLKSLGSFGSPNGILGYSQANNVLINHFASLGGIFLVSLVCVFINVLLFLLIIATLKQHMQRSVVLLLPIILSLLSSYFYQIPVSSSSKSISVATMQANHPMPYKFKQKNRASIRRDYLRMSEDAIKQHHPNLIIWPETITASLNLRFKSLMTPVKTMSMAETAFIIGSPRKENESFYNSAAFITSQNVLTYDKIQLMPFGEYWPFKHLFQFFHLSNIIPGSEFTHGKTPTLFELNTIQLAPIICLESTNSILSRFYANQGANVLISLVNNAWFKDSSIAARQIQMLQFRSIEVGLPSIQSANMGFTCFIDAYGNITGILNKYQQDYLFQKMNCVDIATPFRKWGNGIILVACLIVIAYILKVYYRQRKERLYNLILS